jgi:hypothetical protein
VKLRHFLPLALVVVVLGGLLLSTAPPGGARSALDATPKGYRAAYAWLETRGPVRTFDQPFSELQDLDRGTTLLVVWPLERPLEESADTANLLAWIAQGNRVVLALDGSAEDEPPIALVDDALGATISRETPKPPWEWAEWEAWESARRTAAGRFGTLSSESPEWWIACPGEAIATSADGTVRVCRIPRGDGEAIVVMDASIWQNDHIGRADNLALLAEVFGSGSVAVDEYHHGDTILPSLVPTWVPGLLLAHLTLGWLILGVSLSRRFGDPLPPPAIARASMASALHALSTLHLGVGHAPDAGRRLLALLSARAHRKGVDPAVFGAPPSTHDRAFAAWAARAAALARELRL